LANVACGSEADIEEPMIDVRYRLNSGRRYGAPDVSGTPLTSRIMADRYSMAAFDSNDLLKLLCAALQGAIHSEADIFELVTADPPTKPLRHRPKPRTFTRRDVHPVTDYQRDASPCTRVKHSFTCWSQRHMHLLLFEPLPGL
jgi:hypothetical protein